MQHPLNPCSWTKWLMEKPPKVWFLHPWEAQGTCNQAERDMGIRKQITANLSSISIKQELSVWLLAYKTNRNQTQKQHNKLITQPKKLWAGLKPSNWDKTILGLQFSLSEKQAEKIAQLPRTILQCLLQIWPRKEGPGATKGPRKQWIGEPLQERAPMSRLSVQDVTSMPWTVFLPFSPLSEWEFLLAYSVSSTTVNWVHRG